MYVSPSLSQRNARLNGTLVLPGHDPDSMVRCCNAYLLVSEPAESLPGSLAGLMGSARKELIVPDLQEYGYPLDGDHITPPGHFNPSLGRNSL